MTEQRSWTGWNRRDYTVIRLDNKNLCEYVSFPEFVTEKLKNGNMSYTHFSDLLRLGLLNLYGGVWLDATILASWYRTTPASAKKSR